MAAVCACWSVSACAAKMSSSAKVSSSCGAEGRQGPDDPPAPEPAGRVAGEIEAVKVLHHQDLEEGFGAMYIPEALARKDPKTLRETYWPWVFPARERSLDPRSAREMRPHMRESGLQKAVKQAAQQAGIDKKTGWHTLRHRVATHMLEHGVHIRVLQELLGHAEM